MAASGPQLLTLRTAVLRQDVHAMRLASKARSCRAVTALPRAVRSAGRCAAGGAGVVSAQWQWRVQSRGRAAKVTVGAGAGETVDDESERKPIEVDPELVRGAAESGLAAAKEAAARGETLSAQVQASAAASAAYVGEQGHTREMQIAIATQVANRVATSAGAIMKVTNSAAEAEAPADPAEPIDAEGKAPPEAGETAPGAAQTSIYGSGSVRRRMQATFTCNECNSRTSRFISKEAYTTGTVYVQCGTCEVWHLLKDNLDQWGEEVIYAELED